MRPILLCAVLTLLLGPYPAALVQDADGSVSDPAGGLEAPSAAPAPPADTSLELLDATLWMQRAAERQALCLQTFALAGARLREALADPGWSALPAAPGSNGARPPAVIVDVDETLLDNHYYQARLVLEGSVYDSDSWNAWCREQRATPLPGALAFCRDAARRGVTVFYVTNRASEVREETRATLRAWGFPLRDDLEVLRTLEPGHGSDKTERRAAIAASHRVLLLVGDAGGDFAAELHRGNSVSRAASVRRHAQRWGREWIVLPNPMYGAWESTTYGYDYGLPAAAKRDARLAALLSEPAPDAGPADLQGSPAARPDGERRAAEDAGRVPNDADRPSPTPTPEPAHVDGEDAARAGLAAGPMPAWSTHTSAALWLQTTRPVEAQLRVWPAGDPGAARLLPSQSTRAADDHLALFELHGLEPGSTYETELFLDGQRVARPWPVRLRTWPLWLFRGASREHLPPQLTLALGSCAYVNDPPFDRPGAPYGGGERIFDSIAEARPDAMLWLGDNVYFRPGDWDTEAAMRRRYAHTRASPALQRLLGVTQHYATWDDHDFGPNDSDRSFPLAAEAREIFGDYWPARSLGSDGRGVQRRVVLGDVELFLLDDRSFRSPNDAAPGPDKVMLGAAQLAWLIDGLASSPATFKLVVNGGQMLNPIVNYEGFGEFPDEQRRLLDALVQHDVRGVLFISGDRHQSELLRVQREGWQPWYEFTCSPLTASAVDRDVDGANAARVPGTLVLERNFGLLRVTGAWGDRRLTLSTHDADGQQLWEHTIHQDDVR